MPLDAVARDLQQGVVARIEFTLDLSKAGQCDLVCCDTGLGTASIEKLFKCFNSSKAVVASGEGDLREEEKDDYEDEEVKKEAIDVPMSGKFGVGLERVLTVFLLGK